MTFHTAIKRPSCAIHYRLMAIRSFDLPRPSAKIQTPRSTVFEKVCALAKPGLLIGPASRAKFFYA